MAKVRRFLLEIDAEGLTDRQYVDLGHALYCTAQGRTPGGFVLKQDGDTPNEVFNERWRQLGDENPWR